MNDKTARAADDFASREFKVSAPSFAMPRRKVWGGAHFQRNADAALNAALRALGAGETHVVRLNGGEWSYRRIS